MKAKRPPARFLLAGVVLAAHVASGAIFHVAVNGDDSFGGTSARPFATLAGAQRHLRESGLLRREPIEVVVHAGVYYLDEPLEFAPADSGSTTAPVTYRAADGAEVVLSGGQRLVLAWQPGRDGIMCADVPADCATDQLFLNGIKLPLARYPNFDATVAILNGYSADALSPARTARWAAPAGGFVHALHEQAWGGQHYRITGRAADGTPTLEGGWQNNRPRGLHPVYRFVENIREELDAPGEWLLDRPARKLYLIPPEGTDLARAVVESVRWRELVAFRGTEQAPVRDIALQGFTFRHAARTFMDTREPLLRSDWTIYRGGAVFLSGAEDCTLTRCRVEQIGGNAIFVSGYNRRITVRECVIDAAGGSGVLFVGDPSAVRNALFHYDQRLAATDLDLTPGPLNNTYPMQCLVEDCVIRDTGRLEKQSAGVEISMARRISVAHCSIYGVPRAGINIGDGTWGGHVIEGCDIFDTVLETGDHGSFNAWGRDRYWQAEGASPADRRALASLDAIEPVVIRRNRWRCDRGWDIDLDDGASNYDIHENLLLGGGLKLREGFNRRATNNVIVNNTLHPHVWFAGSGDVFARNIVMTRYRPARMTVKPWGETIDHNFFTSREADRVAFAAEGCDGHSLVGDPRFLDPARGDFRVQDDSPVRRTGFHNFPMDEFGVRPPALRAEVRQPAIPPLRSVEEIDTPPLFHWQGATVRALAPGEFSAFGVPEAAGGVLVTTAPPASRAAQDGIQAGDLIRALGANPVRSPADFARQLDRQPGGRPVALKLSRAQTEFMITIPPPVGRPEKATGR